MIPKTQDDVQKNEKVVSYIPVIVQELQYAELHIIKMVQNEAFRDEIQ